MICACPPTAVRPTALVPSSCRVDPGRSSDVISDASAAHRFFPCVSDVSNLNAIIEVTPELEDLSLYDIMVTTEGTTFNNAAQVINSCAPRGRGVLG